MTFEVRGFQARLQQTERITGYMCNRLICCHHWHPEQVTTLPEKLALKWPKIISVTLERITCYIRARQICGHECHSRQTKHNFGGKKLKLNLMMNCMFMKMCLIKNG